MWTLTSADATGDAVHMEGRPDGSVQFVGTFDGATAVLEWSNDGTNFITHNDENATALEFTATGGGMFVLRSKWIRVSSTGGGGSQSIQAYLILGD